MGPIQQILNVQVQKKVKKPMPGPLPVKLGVYDANGVHILNQRWVAGSGGRGQNKTPWTRLGSGVHASAAVQELVALVEKNLHKLLVASGPDKCKWIMPGWGWDDELPAAERSHTVSQKSCSGARGLLWGVPSAPRGAAALRAWSKASTDRQYATAWCVLRAV